MTAIVLLYLLGVVLVFLLMQGMSSIGSAVGCGGPGFPIAVMLGLSALWPVLAAGLIFMLAIAAVMQIIVALVEGFYRCRSKKV